MSTIKACHPPQSQNPYSELLSMENWGSSDTLVKYSGRKGQTVLALLQKKAVVTTEPKTWGALVTVINGHKSHRNQIWAFFVNGRLLPHAPDFHLTSEEELIEWRLVTIN